MAIAADIRSVIMAIDARGDTGGSETSLFYCFEARSMKLRMSWAAAFGGQEVAVSSENLPAEAPEKQAKIKEAVCSQAAESEEQWAI